MFFMKNMMKNIINVLREEHYGVIQYTYTNPRYICHTIPHSPTHACHVVADGEEDTATVAVV